jgi:hypothetical protein
VRPRPSSDSLHQWQRRTHGDTHLHSDLWRTKAQGSHRGASVGSPTAQSNRHIEENVVTPGTRSVRPLDPQLFRSNSGARKNGFKHNGMGNTHIQALQSSPAPGAARAASQAKFWSFHCPANGVESFRHRGPSPCRNLRPDVRSVQPGRAQPQRDSHLQGALSGRTWLRQRKPGTAAAGSAPLSPSS